MPELQEKQIPALIKCLEHFRFNYSSFIVSRIQYIYLENGLFCIRLRGVFFKLNTVLIYMEKNRTILFEMKV